MLINACRPFAGAVSSLRLVCSVSRIEKKRQAKWRELLGKTKRGTMIATLEVNRRGAKFAVSISLRAT